MSFLTELSKRQTKPSIGLGLGKMQSFGLARALQLDMDHLPSLEKKTTSQTYPAPFAKSAIEILRELERKANETAQGNDTPESIDPVEKTLATNSSNNDVMNRRNMNATTIDTSNQDENDIPSSTMKRNSSRQPHETDNQVVDSQVTPGPIGRYEMIHEMMKHKNGFKSINGKTDLPPNTIQEELKKQVIAPQDATQLPSTDSSNRSDEMANKRTQVVQETTRVKSTGDDKGAMLQEMMKKRNGGNSGGDGRNAMLAQLMQKRSSPPADTPKEPKSTGDDKGAMLQEMMKKRNGGNSGGDGRNAMLAQLMQKRSSPPADTPKEPKSTGDDKGAMLQEMMKKRNGGNSGGDGRNAMLAQLMQKRSDPPADTPKVPESTNEPPAQSTDVPLKDDPKYSTYFLMLKRGLPKPAVQHRMIKENVDPAILDMDPNQPFKVYTIGTDPAYEKYFKMLKTGLPRPVVEHKLRSDGISPHLLDLSVDAPSIPKDQIDRAFQEHQEKVVEKYKKMLKLGMPPGAVEHAMIKDNVDPTWLNPSATTRKNSSFIVRKVTKPDRVRKKLHWVVLNKDAMQESTLWKQPSQVLLSDASIASLERLFTKSIKEESKLQKNEADAATKSSRDLLQVKVINLMDMKKAQNIGITLARIKVPFEKIKDEILNMNPTIMSSMHLKALIDLWPDSQEMKAIREFQGDFQTLGFAERFCYAMKDTPRFTEKLQCLIFKQEFISRSHELRETILLVLRCVNQICSSTDLRDVLVLILKMGNVLNFGKESNDGVKGFSLSSLVKLSQTRAFHGQTTLLQFLVEVVDRDAPHLAQFDEEIGLLERASRVVTQQLYLEKKALEAGRGHLEAEAQRILNEDNETNLTAAAIRFFLSKVDLELNDLNEQLNLLNEKKIIFLNYIGEESNYELDELFSVLWSFTEEFRAAHRKYVLKKARSKKKTLYC